MVAGAARRQGPHLPSGKGDVRGSLAPLTACFMRAAPPGEGIAEPVRERSNFSSPNIFAIYGHRSTRRVGRHSDVCEELSSLCMDVAAERSLLASAIVDALHEAELLAQTAQ
jgi:hypothetical protein